MKKSPLFFSALISGILFGFGLACSGMLNPTKVLDFLNFRGDWDPSLAFVMIGALCVTTPGLWWAKKRPHPLFREASAHTITAKITPELVLGSVLFGAGWGLSGICPGPALSGLIFAPSAVLAFALSMVVGMIFYHYLLNRRHGKR